jgi:hypothetical protein
VTVIAVGLCFTYSMGDGLHDVALATAVMPTMVGLVVAVDYYGPITGYAGGIAEMAELPHGGSAMLDDIFTDLPGRLPVRNSHGDALTRLPAGFHELARTASSVAAIGDDRGRVGLMFHPEVSTRRRARPSSITSSSVSVAAPERGRPATSSPRASHASKSRWVRGG